MNLKETLLKLGIFDDNEYLDKYVALVLNNKDRMYVKHKTNLHHIIPKYYFKYKNICIDNSKENLVNLLYKDHILAHFYLAKCSLIVEQKNKNILSIRFLLHGKSIEDFHINEIDLDKYQILYEDSIRYNKLKTHSNDTNKKISEKLIGRVSPNKGNRYASFENEKSRGMNPNAKNKKLSYYASKRIGELNSFYGKKHTKESKDKMSKAHSKPVEMLDFDTKETIRIFQSGKEASDFLIENNIIKCKSGAKRISMVCNSNDLNQKAYGYSWRFLNKV